MVNGASPEIAPRRSAGGRDDGLLGRVRPRKGFYRQAGVSRRRSGVAALKSAIRRAAEFSMCQVKFLLSKWAGRS